MREDHASSRRTLIFDVVAQDSVCEKIVRSVVCHKRYDFYLSFNPLYRADGDRRKVGTKKGLFSDNYICRRIASPENVTPE